MTIYYLAEHAYACVAKGHIVFLDIKNDRYSALPTDVSAVLNTLVASRTIGEADLNVRRPDIQAALENLVTRGLLLTSPPSQMPVRPRIVNQPYFDLSEANIEGHRTVNVSHVLKFIWAYGKALFGTKIRGLDGLIRGLSRVPGNEQVADKDHHTLSQAMDAFRFIRIFFYKEIDHCYFDCAVTMYFLRHFGFDPIWVFGVQMEPFRAHCWVQVGDVLVTGHLGETTMFRPILAV